MGQTTPPAGNTPEAPAPPEPAESLDIWRDRALRLQAEMENYRRRQQRLAQDQVSSERERLLASFLQVVDNLERALKAPAGEGDGLRRGLELTHHAALQLLRREGAEPISAEGQPFDPAWHDAVATVGSDGRSARPQTVVEIIEQGYRLGDRLLRPARVVVAL